MVTTAAALAFGLALLPVVLTPGASFTLVTARSLSGDRRGAISIVAGTAAGILTHAVLAGWGLAALVMESAQAYTAIRLLGAVVLIVLGLHLVWNSRGGVGLAPASQDSGRRGSVRGTLVQAYAANVLNVKAAAVYLTLAPQLLTSDSVNVASMSVLAGIHIAIMAVWLTLWAYGWSMLSQRIDPQVWRRRFDRAGGLVLIALGIRTAVAPR